MKVLVYGNGLFSIDMLWGFSQAGWETALSTAPSAKDMARDLEKTGASLLITLGAPLELRLGVMEWLGKSRPSGVTHIHWDTDGISSTYYPSRSGDGIEMDVIYASRPDLVLTICPEMCEVIRGKGFPCEMMHYAVNPAIHHPQGDDEARHDEIQLIGNSYSHLYARHPDHYRFASLKILVKPLFENKYPLHLYGDSGYLPFLRKLLDVDVSSAHYHRYLPYSLTCGAYNDSFINLITQNHLHTITKRTFEILGSGGFALSPDTPAVRKLFTPGRDLAVSSSPEETLELVRHYEKNRDEWEAIRKNAALSVQNHTYKQRAEFILGHLRNMDRL